MSREIPEKPLPEGGFSHESSRDTMKWEGEDAMEEKTLTNAVVVFPERGTKIMLARKTRKIGAGCLNGYGGGIDGDENSEEAALRELYEESGLRASLEGLQKIAVVDFHNQKSDGSLFTCRVHMYLASDWTGALKETEEMQEPAWYEKTALPLDRMMPADREWLPLALAGTKVQAEAWYGPFQKELLRPTIVREVTSFE